jgi:transcriptional regulator with XRE-family HTH domain
MKSMSGNLKKLRDSAGKTQEETAFHLGISRAAYSSLESGKTKTLKNTYAIKLADFFGVNVEVILNGIKKDESIKNVDNVNEKLNFILKKLETIENSMKGNINSK